MKGILSSTKQLAGMTDEYTAYDKQIIMYINSVFLVLKQLGIGPPTGFYITDDSYEWKDFIPGEEPEVEFLRETVKAYMGDKVRLKFDPPSSSAHLEALKQNIAEMEWRLCAEGDTT